MDHSFQKIDKLLEESFLKAAQSKIQKIFNKIKPIPKNILDKIYQKFNTKNIIQEATFKPAPKIEGETDSRDSCYTAVMKLIGKPNLVKKYKNLDAFLEKYTKLQPVMIAVSNQSQKGIAPKQLKPGTILVGLNDEPHTAAANRAFGKFGMVQQAEHFPGHMYIYLGKDPSKKDKPYTILHNGWAMDNREIGTSGMELRVENKNDKWFDRYYKNDNPLVIIDYKIIEKM